MENADSNVNRKVSVRPSASDVSGRIYVRLFADKFVYVALPCVYNVWPFQLNVFSPVKLGNSCNCAWSKSSQALLSQNMGLLRRITSQLSYLREFLRASLNDEQLPKDLLISTSTR